MTLVLAILLALSQPIATLTTSPAPSASPLKVIVHTKTSPFCSALRESIAPAIQGILVNDGIVAQSKNGYTKMAHDFVEDPRGSAMQLDEMQFQILASDLTRNLAKIDALLADPRLNASTTSVDSVALVKMRDQFVAVAKQQGQTLNLINGSLTTADYYDIKTHPLGLDGTLGKHVDDTQGSTGTNGGFYQPTNMGGPSPVVSDPAVQLAAGALANNPYGRYSAVLVAQEQQTGEMEDAAAATVLANAPSCR